MSNQVYTVTVAEKQQLDAQNQMLAEINAKIMPKDLSSVIVSALDFVNGDITITSGGLDSINRRITT